MKDCVDQLDAHLKLRQVGNLVLFFSKSSSGSFFNPAFHPPKETCIVMNLCLKIRETHFSITPSVKYMQYVTKILEISVIEVQQNI